MSSHSHRLESLAHALCLAVGKRQNPFETVHIWVPHEGMASWLKHTLATELGVAAQLQFSQPRTALWQMAQQLFPQRRLKLTQVELLLTLQHQLAIWVSEHKALKIFAHYLQGHAHYALSLASACAQTFEDYLTYRPDWIMDFSQQAPGTLPLPADIPDLHADLWLAQHTLWHLLEQHVDPQHKRWHRAQLQSAVLDTLSAPLAQLPARWPGQHSLALQVFALIEDAPFYTRMLDALPRHIAVQRYTLDESPLAQGDFSQAYWNTSAESAFSHAAATTPDAFPPEIQVHGCHHALREVEVLHDLIKHHQTPAGQVGVVVWDLEHYRPLIHGVFRDAFLPYSLPENPQDSLLVQTFEALVESYQGRLLREDVLNLIENEWVASAFGFQGFSAEELRQTLDRVDIRWGRNDFHREQLGLPAFGQNSWEAGIQRLLLSYALPDQGGRPYKQRLPEGQEMPRLDILRALLRFFDAAQRYLTPCFKSHTLPQWRHIFHDILDHFLGSVEVESLLPLREAVGRLPEFAEQLPQATENERLVSLGEAQALLALCWPPHKGHHLHPGRIRFGTPEQMAGLPFQDVYMLGLNLGVVPAKTRRNDLNLRWQSPARAEELRSQTQDFRRFLRCMYGVRQRWILMYQNHHVRHQNELAPAGILDALIHHCQLTVTPHALQAFDPGYFEPQSKFPSYHPLYRHCAETLRNHPHRAAAPLFRQAPLKKDPAVTPELLPIAQFQQFFQRPAHHFLRHKLGVYYPSAEDQTESHERFALKGLEKYQLQSEALHAYIRYEGELSAFKQRMLATGKLPVGHAGAWFLEHTLQELEPFFPVLRSLFAVETAHYQGAWQADGQAEAPPPLHGQFMAYHLPYLAPGALHVQWRPGRFKANAMLKLWIEHLWMPLGLPQEGIISCTLALDPKTKTPSLFYIDPLDTPRARELLQSLMAIYTEGQRVPLPFAPKTSWAFAESYLDKKQRSLAEKAARKSWETDHFTRSPGDSEDASFAHCLETDWFTQDESQALALAIFEPLSEALRCVPLSQLDPTAPFERLLSASPTAPSKAVDHAQL